MLHRRVERLLGAESERAKAIIRRRREDVERVAKLLEKKELVSGDEIREFLVRRDSTSAKRYRATSTSIEG